MSTSLKKIGIALASTANAGFTLLEMLMVVALLAVIAGLGVAAYDTSGNDDAIATQLAQSEMTELAKALRQFRRDVGQYPTVAHPADFSPLFVFVDNLNNVTAANTPDTLDDNGGYRVFNRDTGRGWNGPYLERRGIGCAVFSGYANVANGIVTYAKMDPFRRGQPPAGLRWREYNTSNQCTDDNLTNKLLTGRLSSAYLLIEMPTAAAPNPANPRIVSVGTDGVYGGVNTLDACQPNRTNNPSDPGNDDLVMCL